MHRAEYTHRIFSQCSFSYMSFAHIVCVFRANMWNVIVLLHAQNTTHIISHQRDYRIYQILNVQKVQKVLHTCNWRERDCTSVTVKLSLRYFLYIVFDDKNEELVNVYLILRLIYSKTKHAINTKHNKLRLNLFHTNSWLTCT